jgi:NAD(P)H-dependent flavin oxidoreductase YrpB (nitropropane dioxygenase family)
VTGPRHFSQRIAEGDGISIIVHVADADAARQAEEQGAEALAIAHPIDGIREATTLPLLWMGHGKPHDADACAVRLGDHPHQHVETVVTVRDAEELEEALEELDPEIFLLAAGEDEEADPFEVVLELLADVPAGKLAIAQVHDASRDEVVALERAGMDAVLVPGGHVAELVGHAPVDV